MCTDPECWKEKAIEHTKREILRYLCSIPTNTCQDKHYLLFNAFSLDDDKVAELTGFLTAKKVDLTKIVLLPCYSYNTEIEMEQIEDNYKQYVMQAFYIDGNEKGKTTLITIMPDDKSNESKGAIEATGQTEMYKLIASLKLRQNRHLNKQKRATVQILMDILPYEDGTECSYLFPSFTQLLLLTNMLGSSINQISTYDKRHMNIKKIINDGKDVELDEFDNIVDNELSNKLRRIESLAHFSEAEKIEQVLSNQQELLWEDLALRIISELKYGQAYGNPARWKEATEISKIIKFNLEEAFEKVCKELPESKSWTTLINKIEKYKAAAMIIEDAINTTMGKDKKTRYLIPVYVLKTFGIGYKPEYCYFAHYIQLREDDGNKYDIDCAIVDEKIKDRITKCIAKLLLIDINSINITTTAKYEIYTWVTDERIEIPSSWDAANISAATITEI